MISAFLFDLDGTLTVTEKLKKVARVQAVADFGGSINIDDITPLVGKSEKEVRDAVLAMAKLDVPGEELTARFEERYLELLQDGIELVPGATDFLRSAHDKGIRLALVTASSKDMLTHNPTIQNLLPLFTVIITADDGLKSKPEPEPYLTALERLGATAAESVAFEDSSPGKAAAIAAGIRTVFIRHNLNRQVNNEDALHVIDAYSSDLLDHLLSL